MAKKSLKSIVYGIKEIYTTATKDAEVITYGNIEPKLEAALGSGSSGGYGGVSVIPIQSVAEAMPTTVTITISA